MLLPGQSQSFTQPYEVQDASTEFVVRVAQPRMGSGQSADGVSVVVFHGTPVPPA